MTIVEKMWIDVVNVFKLRISAENFLIERKRFWRKMWISTRFISVFLLRKTEIYQVLIVSVQYNGTLPSIFLNLVRTISTSLTVLKISYFSTEGEGC